MKLLEIFCMVKMCEPGLLRAANTRVRNSCLHSDLKSASTVRELPSPLGLHFTVASTVFSFEVLASRCKRIKLSFVLACRMLVWLVQVLAALGLQGGRYSEGVRSAGILQVGENPGLTRPTSRSEENVAIADIETDSEWTGARADMNQTAKIFGEFGPVITFPLVPVAAALLPDGKVWLLLS
jgi:hypothetical protein